MTPAHIVIDPGDALLRDDISAQQTAADGPFLVSVSRSIEALDGLEAEWRALEAVNATPCLFQSFDWCRNHLRHSIETRAHLQTVIVTIRQGRRLVALLPLCVQVNKGTRVLTGLTEPFQQYTEMLLAPGADAARMWPQMLQALRGVKADYLHLGQVRIDSNLHRALAGRVPPSGEEDAAPFVEIGAYADFAAFHKTVNAKTRKNMRNARNRLERDAPVSHCVARSGELLCEVIDRTFAGRGAWLEQQGLTSRAFRDRSFGTFLSRFKHPEATGIETVAFSLRHGEVVVADQWGFIHKGRYYAFVASWNPDYEESSPGKMHLGEILASCHALGITSADFLIPAARYKFTWASDAIPVRDYVLPLTLKGRLHNSLWLNLLRPMAKRLAYRLPAGVRAAIFRRILPIRD